MDMSQFAGSSFVKLSDVTDSPIRGTIVGISQGKWDKPDILLSTGDKFSANATNCRVLLRAYGKDDDDWIGKEIELYAGELEYQNEKKPGVVVRPISPPTVKPSLRGDGDKLPFDDEIQFNK